MNPDRWPRIKELFHGALARPHADRRAFLDEACAGEEALQAEVQRLLDAHAQAGSFIDSSPVFAMAGAALPPAGLTGRILGHYQVGRLIGVGGMGEVYAAFDTDLRRDVAIKVVAGGDLEAQAGLRREAQHASQLNHPHICTIHEVGSIDGQAFIVMEYVEGQPLSELAAGDGLPLETMLRYGVQIADALAHAHDHGVIHRDLKTANVVVTSERRAKILDFGLARGLPPERAQAISHSRAALTEERLVAGTLSYLSPELLRGQAADPVSDIWALGVVLYEMAAGRTPFRGATGFELCAAIMHSPPAPLPDRIPAPLQTIIGRCLAKDRGERYQEAAQVRGALEGIQADVTGDTRDAPLMNAAKRVLRSRVAILALVGLLTVAVASPLVWRWARPTSAPAADATSGPPAIAVMYFENVAGGEDTAWLSKGVPSMLLTSLAQSRGLRIVSTQRLHETVRQLGEASLDTLDKGQAADVARRAGAGAVVVGSILKFGSELRIDAQVEDLASGRVLLAESVRGTDPFGLIDQLAARIRDGIGLGNATDIRGVADVSSTSLEAYRLYSEGKEALLNQRMGDARHSLERAVAIDPTFAQAYLQLAAVSEFQDLPAARAEYLRSAAAHADRLSERERLSAEVESAREAGDFAKAARLLDALIGRFPDFEDAYISTLLYEPFRGALYDPEKYVALSAAGSRTFPQSGAFHNGYAYALLSVGRYEEALHELETYVRLAVREPNPYDSTAEAYLMMGVPEKAIDYYSKALTIDPTFSGAHGGRAWGLAMLGRYDQAIAENPPGFAVKAFIVSRVGRYREAASVIRTGEQQAANNRNVGEQGDMHLLSSLLAVERKDDGRALREVRAAAQSFEQLAGERKRFNLVLVDLVAGMAEVRAGRPARARPYLESQRLRYRPERAAEKWWHHALEGDIALAEGRLQDAAAAYATGEPSGRLWTGYVRTPLVAIMANNLPSRDGAARVMKAQGNLTGAIQEYRRLTTAGTGQEWMAMLEPRYVLEMARLLDQAGDREAGRREYRRFLDLWKDADPDLPELAEARRALERIR